MRARVYWPVTIAAALLVGLLAYGLTTTGTDTTLDDVLVNVWASWCEPCRDELPLIEKAHKMLSTEGGTVLGIDVKENTDAAMKAVGEFGLTFPNLRDRDGSFVRKWGQTGYPENYVIDRDGRVAAVRRFPVTQKWLDKTLPPLLDEKD